MKKEYRCVTNYITPNNIFKEIVYFIADPKTKNIILQETEVIESKWLSIKEALNIITHENIKEIIKELEENL